MYNGYVKSLPKDVLEKNELETLQKLSANGNTYWQAQLDEFVKTHPRLSAAAVHRPVSDFHYQALFDDMDALACLVDTVKFEPTPEQRDIEIWQSEWTRTYADLR